MLPQDLLYTNEHEWVKIEGDTATVGITDHAQDMLGDVTFVELPSEGDEFKQGDEVCAIESAKAAASVYAALGGTITEVNAALEDSPELMNSEPYGEGWVYKMQISDAGEASGLMDAAKYAEFMENEAH